MSALPFKSMAMSWFQCTTCWKIFKLRIQLATHLKKCHNEEGSVRSAIDFSENEKYRAKTNDQDEQEKVSPTQNMTACHASDAFICGFDSNEQLTDLQMKSAHCLEAHKSEISQPGKTFPNNNEFSLQQTSKTILKEIPVYDISSSEDESTLPANANGDRRVEVEEKVPVTTCESLGNCSTVTNLIQQHNPESILPSQLNHLRISSPFTNRKNKDEVIKSHRLRQGKMLHKRRPRRCPYCFQNFLLSVDIYRHIKAVHGQLLTQNFANCNESTKPAVAVISKSSYTPKSYANGTRPHVGSGSTYSIQGYKCQLCLKTFPRLTVFQSHFRVRHGFFRFIPSFVLKQQQNEQLSLSSTKSPEEGNILLGVKKVQKSVDLTVRSGTANKRSESQEVKSKEMLLEREENQRTARRSKSVEIIGDPPVQVEVLKVNRKAKLKFKCPSCPKLFGGRRLRDDHFTVHSGKRRYKCPVCDRRIRFYQSFQRHMKKFHRNTNYTVSEAEDGKIEVVSTQERQEVINFLVTYNPTTESVHAALPKKA